MTPTDHDNPPNSTPRATPRATPRLLATLTGLGPLLAAAHDLAGGLALGLASFAVLCLCNLYAATAGRLLPPRQRPAALLVLVGALVTAADLGFQAWWPPRDGTLLLFVPLIITNGVILDSAGQWADQSATWPAVGHALSDSLRHGVAFVLLLAGWGALRAALAPSLGIALTPAGLLFLLAGLLAVSQLLSHRPGPPPGAQPGPRSAS